MKQKDVKVCLGINNIIIKLSDKCGGIVIRDSAHINNKIIELSNDKNMYEQISLQTITKHLDVFSKSYKKTNH